MRAKDQEEPSTGELPGGLIAAGATRSTAGLAKEGVAARNLFF
jgi:hypothetical protein